MGSRKVKTVLAVAAVLLLLWAIALAAVFVFPLMFPPMESASFFSTTLVEDPQPNTGDDHRHRHSERGVERRQL